MAKPKFERREINFNEGELQKMWHAKGPQFRTVKTEKIENWWRDNSVRTTKYTLWNFIPLNLFTV
jgi:hypothetical protein